MAVVREALKSVIQSDAWKKTSRWVRGSTPGAPARHEIDATPVPASVVVYFGDTAAKNYQMQQWLPVLERLHKTHPVLLVFRRVGALRDLKSETRLPKIFVRRFEDLMTLYGENHYSLILYVNNGMSNFQSLNEAHAVHVHVNHGESDKISMVSNQVKAYDKVFVAGPAAIARHERVLHDFDMSKLQTVGRPQLDIEFDPELDAAVGLRTVMYAPTWSGENDANNYTSVDLYGVQIVQSLLKAEGVRVVYKPHPRVADASAGATKSAHEAIVAAIKADAAATDRPHLVLMEGNILAMFGAVDALITDVSSVGLDFLYSHPEKPIVLTDRRTDRAALNEEAPISAGCAVIDANSVAELDELLRGALREDRYASKRADIRGFYFGDIQPGESSALFEQEIERLIADRSMKIEERRLITGKDSPSVVGE